MITSLLPTSPDDVLLLAFKARVLATNNVAYFDQIPYPHCGKHGPCNVLMPVCSQNYDTNDPSSDATTPRVSGPIMSGCSEGDSLNPFTAELDAAIALLPGIPYRCNQRTRRTASCVSSACMLHPCSLSLWSWRLQCNRPCPVCQRTCFDSGTSVIRNWEGTLVTRLGMGFAVSRVSI